MTLLFKKPIYQQPTFIKLLIIISLNFYLLVRLVSVLIALVLTLITFSIKTKKCCWNVCWTRSNETFSLRNINMKILQKFNLRVSYLGVMRLSQKGFYWRINEYLKKILFHFRRLHLQQVMVQVQVSVYVLSFHMLNNYIVFQ